MICQKSTYFHPFFLVAILLFNAGINGQPVLTANIGHDIKAQISSSVISDDGRYMITTASKKKNPNDRYFGLMNLVVWDLKLDKALHNITYPGHTYNPMFVGNDSILLSNFLYGGKNWSVYSKSKFTWAYYNLKTRKIDSLENQSHQLTQKTIFNNAANAFLCTNQNSLYFLKSNGQLVDSLKLPITYPESPDIYQFRDRNDLVLIVPNKSTYSLSDSTILVADVTQKKITHRFTSKFGLTNFDNWQPISTSKILALGAYYELSLENGEEFNYKCECNVTVSKSNQFVASFNGSKIKLCDTNNKVKSPYWDFYEIKPIADAEVQGLEDFIGGQAISNLVFSKFDDNLMFCTVGGSVFKIRIEANTFNAERIGLLASNGIKNVYDQDNKAIIAYHTDDFISILDLENGINKKDFEIKDHEILDLELKENLMLVMHKINLKKYRDNKDNKPGPVNLSSKMALFDRNQMLRNYGYSNGTFLSKDTILLMTHKQFTGLDPISNDTLFSIPLNFTRQRGRKLPELSIEYWRNYNLLRLPDREKFVFLDDISNELNVVFPIKYGFTNSRSDLWWSEVSKGFGILDKKPPFSKYENYQTANLPEPYYSISNIPSNRNAFGYTDFDHYVPVEKGYHLLDVHHENDTVLMFKDDIQLTDFKGEVIRKLNYTKLNNRGQAYFWGKTKSVYSFDGSDRIDFWNLDSSLPGTSVTLTQFHNPKNWIFLKHTPKDHVKYYTGPKESVSEMYYVDGLKVISFDQYDLLYNRPDKILKEFGSRQQLLKSYENAYVKRLKKMGFGPSTIDLYLNHEPEEELNAPEVIIDNSLGQYVTTNEKSISVPITVFDNQGFALERLFVNVNDVPLYGLKGKTLDLSSNVRFEEELNIDLVPGKNIIGIKVLNEQGIYSYEQIIEVFSNAKFSDPKLFIVSIGASKYQDTNFNLTYASKDASDLSQLFSKNSTFENVELISFSDEKVLRDPIVATKELLMKTLPQDQVIVFYAGHGLLDKNYDYFLTTFDTDFNNPSANGLPYEALEGLLDGIPARNKLMLIDACHSGEVDKDEIETTTASTITKGNVKFRGFNSVKAKENALGLPNSFELMKQLFNDVRNSTGAVVISSASGVEFAFESPEWNNGVFTYSLLEGIREQTSDIDQNKNVNVSELKNYVFKRVTELTNGLQNPTSRQENLENDFVIWKY